MAGMSLRPHLAAYQPQLDQLDAAALTPIVCRALSRRGVVPVSWRWFPVLYAAYYPRRMLVRLAGEATVGGETFAWAAVVKISESPAEEARSTSATAAWDREVRAYQSGLLRHLPDGLAAPRAQRIGTDADGAVWLWLEHVADAFGGQWPLAQYGIAARHLGRFNGVYGTHATGRPLPAYRWLNQLWAESHAEPALLPDARREVGELLAHLDVRGAVSASTADRLRRLLDDQPIFLDTLARLPQTLCHHDASSANLFARRRATPGQATDEGDEGDTWETVAIDWEELGPGPVGAEVATLVFGTMRRGAFPTHRALELEQTVLEGYQRGLRDAGWRGDPQVMLLGYSAAVALRWFVAPAALRLLADPAARARAQRATHQTADILIQQRLALLDFLLDRADEARRLADVG